MTKYLLPKFHFQIKFDNDTIGFTEITGLDLQVESNENREDSRPEYVKNKQPVILKSGKLTLKRGTMPGASDFCIWLIGTSGSEVNRKDIIISLLNENHTPVMSWKIRRALPVKIVAIDSKSNSNEIAIETLELAYKGLNILH